MLKYEWLARLLSDLGKYAAIHNLKEVSTLLDPAVDALANDTGTDVARYREVIGRHPTTFISAEALEACPGDLDEDVHDGAPALKNRQN
ncbi:hypothetical protein LAZ40_05465 [Cereibacter sphaeroides]|uniref:hypothetical protein n=1 Tax=Cereibacter sphaeroides TaxID=1063 RepID=UPI001F2BCDF8|nr:hypothetical protein [Cereibacter sphaeroides]MCE6958497.1 hypothetical protein [Cereibacter sphaeroides]MCE6972841.1 hypothetical protein [Cereibacter sphaeroides]